MKKLFALFLAPHTSHINNVKLFAPLLCVLLFAGCASGPHYTYTQSADSAELRGHGNASTNLSILAVNISRIDGLLVKNSFFTRDKPVHAASGTHSIGLSLRYYDTACFVTFPMELKPAHRYFFTMIPRSKNLEVVVYDTTGPEEEVALRLLAPTSRKGGFIYLPNTKPEPLTD